MSVRNPPANEPMTLNQFCTHRWLLWFNDLLYGHVGDATTLDGVPASGYAVAAHTHTGTYAPVSAWVAVAWDGGNFSGAGGGSWLVTAGQQTTFAYNLDGTRLTIVWQLDGTTTVTAPTALVLALPGSLTAVRAIGGGHVYQTAAGGWDMGGVDIAASGTTALLYTRTRAAWPSESGTVSTRGQIILEAA